MYLYFGFAYYSPCGSKKVSKGPLELDKLDKRTAAAKSINAEPSVEKNFMLFSSVLQ